MKKTFMTFVALACAALVISCGSKAQNITKGDEKVLDTLSYAIGANISGGIKYQLAGVDMNIDIACDVMTDVFEGKAAQTHEEALEVVKEFFGQTLRERYMAHQEALKADSTAVFQAFVNETERQEVSKAFGNDIASGLVKDKNNIADLQYFWFLKGFKDVWNSKDFTDLMVDQKKIMDVLNHYFNVVIPERAAARSAAWIEQKSKGTGVKKTESGLLYKVIEEGDMSKAAKNDEDKVKVHYVGRLQDGTVFDASRFEKRSKEQQEEIRQQMPSLFDENGKIKEEKPIEFPLNGVIKGWTEGMKLVGPGGKVVLYIPAELAYGRFGARGAIGPNEALEFEVELLEVIPAPVKEEVAPATEEKAEEGEKKPEGLRELPTEPATK